MIYGYKHPMLDMAELNTLPLVVPLLFLVVLKLCDIAREINLEEIQGNAPWDVPLWSTYGWGATLPNLGRFNFIHFTNFFLLLYAFNFTFISLESGDTRLMLLMFIVLVWVLLPIFEVKEYDNIPPQEEGEWPSSFNYHYLFVFIIIILYIIIDITRDFISNISIIPGIIPSYFAGLAMLFILILMGSTCIEGFLRRLDDEISGSSE